MKTRAQKITLVAVIATFIVLFGVMLYAKGRELLTDIPNSHACYGEFKWSAVDWLELIIYLFIFSLPLLPWLYWSMRQYALKMNIFKSTLAISCSVFYIFIILYYSKIVFAPTMAEEFYFIPADMPNYMLYTMGIWLLCATLNYAFTVIYFAYKIVRSILAPYYPQIKKSLKSTH